ncbi:MAG: alpha/beta fold hydrolase [Pseudomonadales bacterium]
MTEIVLVHGAWHGAFCWQKVRGFLEERGHTVRTPELPLSEGLDSYVATVLGEIESCHDPVVLVGHSMAGAVISLVAEARPNRIARLVYLAAFAPLDGESINDKARLSFATALRDNMEVNDEGLVTVKPAVIPSAFYHDCDDSDIDVAIRQLRPQNPAAFTEKLSLTADRFGCVPKQYIECIEDQAIHVSLQRRMAQEAGCTLINSMRTSHSPFFSAPAGLGALIARIGIKDTKI